MTIFCIALQGKDGRNEILQIEENARANATIPTLAIDEQQVYCFYSLACSSCMSKVEKLKKWMDDNELPRSNVVFLESSKKDNYELLIQAMVEYGPSAPGSFSVIYQRKFFTELVDIQSLLLSENTNEHDIIVPEAKGVSVKKWIQDFSKKHSMAGLFLIGMIDGVNPCAFYCISVLILMLLWMKKTRAELFRIGAAYTLAMFISYYCIGLLFYQLIDYFSMIGKLKVWFNGFLCILFLGLFIMSLYDAVKYKKNQTKQMKLRLSDRKLSKVEVLVEEKLKGNSLIVSAFSLGAMMALLEAGCTGQVYFPALIAMNAQNTVSNIYLLLTMYNVGFILPLVVIFLLLIWNAKYIVHVREYYQKSGYLSKVAIAMIHLCLFSASFALL